MIFVGLECKYIVEREQDSALYSEDNRRIHLCIYDNNHVLLNLITPITRSWTQMPTFVGSKITESSRVIHHVYVNAWLKKSSGIF